MRCLDPTPLAPAKTPEPRALVPAILVPTFCFPDRARFTEASLYKATAPQVASEQVCDVLRPTEPSSRRPRCRQALNVARFARMPVVRVAPGCALATRSFRVPCLASRTAPLRLRGHSVTRTAAPPNRGLPPPALLACPTEAVAIDIVQRLWFVVYSGQTGSRRR